MWGYKLHDLSKNHLELDENTKKELTKKYNIDTAEFRDKLYQIIEWVKKTTKLPKESQDEYFVSNIFAMNHFNVETTKRKLEGYFKIFLEHKWFFENIESYFDSNGPNNESAVFGLMPSITPSLEKIAIIKFNMSEKSSDLDLTEMILSSIPFGILYTHHIFNVHTRFIIDLEWFTFRQFKTLQFPIVTKLFDIHRKAMKVNVAGFELINTPSFIDSVISALKMVMSEKSLSKIRTHDDLDSLHEHIPKEHLPIEYGGTNINFKELQRNFKAMNEENAEFFTKLSSFVPRKEDYDSLFGIQGTFKSLSID